MKIKCAKKELIDAINTVSKAVPMRSTKEILTNIQLSAADGKLTLIGTDLNISIIKSISVEVEEEGVVAVPAKFFADVVKSLPSEDAIMLRSTAKILNVSTDKLNFKVKRREDESDFPDVMPTGEVTAKLTMNCDMFEKLISETAFAASLDESKGTLTGVSVNISDNNTEVVACDGVRLALSRAPFGEDSEKFVINSTNLAEVAKIAQTKYGTDVTIELLANEAIFTFDDAKAIVRLLEGGYIDYAKIIPESGTTNIAVDKTALKNSISRAILLAKDGLHNLIKCEIAGEVMTISAQTERGDFREEIEVNHSDADITIGFNSRYVLEALNAISDEYGTVKMTMNNPKAPCVVRPIQGDEFEHLILPVNLPSTMRQSEEEKQ